MNDENDSFKSINESNKRMEKGIKELTGIDIENITMNVFNIKGKIERNFGRIIIECGTDRKFFNEFFEALYADDHAEGAEMPIGKYKVKITTKRPLYHKKLTFEFTDEASGYSIQCNQIKGLVSQGATIKEALENISEALIGYFEAYGESELTDAWRFQTI